MLAITRRALFASCSRAYVRTCTRALVMAKRILLQAKQIQTVKLWPIPTQYRILLDDMVIDKHWDLNVPAIDFDMHGPDAHIR